MASNLDDLSDEELIELYVKDPVQKDEAYNALVNRYYQSIIKTARATLYKNSTARLIYEGIDEKSRDIAHDFLLEKFPRVLAHYDRKKGSVGAWIARCMANFTIDSLRERPKGNVESFQVEEEEWKSYRIVVEVLGTESPHLPRDLRDLERIVNDYLNRLPQHYREPIRLRFWEGMQIEEIAKVLHLPVGTVKSQLSRGVDILRQRLQADGLYDELR